MEKSSPESLNALLDEIIQLSNKLVEKLSAQELEAESIQQQEQERGEKLHQLFEQFPTEQLALETAALSRIRELDQQLKVLANDKKGALTQELLKFKRGKSKTSAYKANQL